MLFIIGYLGFSNRQPQGLYKSALSLEFMHDFMLVHDDIIDKSDLRRGSPSMHILLNNYLKKFGEVKFKGEDLAIVIGDLIYALGLRAFLCVKADQKFKEKALSKFIDATVYTACGEFNELLSTIKDISKITREEIYKIYDFKTACYTFATPLSMGALLAGAQDTQAERLFQYGMLTGRAFQIKDDILGIFARESDIGKSVLSDIKEAKKTLLIWHAYHHSSRKDKFTIESVFSKDNVNRSDLLKLRKLINASGALDYARREILRLTNQAKNLLCRSAMKSKYKCLLLSYTNEILSICQAIHK